MARGLGWAAVKNEWRGWWEKSTSEGNTEETVSTNVFRQQFLEMYCENYTGSYLWKERVNIWEINNRRDSWKEECIISIDVHGNKDVLKVRFHLYHFHNILLLHYAILSNNTSLVSWLLIWALIYISFTGLWCLLDNIQRVQVILDMLLYQSISKSYQ